jgi:hypothetical protein
MLRRVELASGFAACVVGLLTLAFLYESLNSTTLLGMDGTGGLRVARVAAIGDVALATLMVAGVGAGAYLHSVFRMRLGLALLWICTAGLTLGLIYTVGMSGPLTQLAPFLLLLASSWLPQLVLTIILAWVSCGASATPPGWSSSHSEVSLSERLP